MYVACICSPMPSHLGQMELALKRLSERGHRVELWGCGGTEAAAKRAGLGYKPLPVEPEVERAAERLASPWDYYAGFSFPLVAGQLPRVLGYCRDDPPDLLHSNARVYTAAVASLVTGIPSSNHSCNGTSFAVVPEDLYGFRVKGDESERKRQLMVSLSRRFHAEVDGEFQRQIGRPFGLAPVENAAGLASRSCVLVFSIRELANQRIACMDYVHFTGPLISDAPGRPDCGAGHERYCYVTLGTWPLGRDRVIRLYEDIVSGIPERYRVFLGLGGRFTAEDLAPLPERVSALSYAPQTSLVRDADFVVCHGGCQTVNEALYFGKPIIAIPPHVTEPRDMTYRAVRAGVCIELDANGASSEAVRNAVERLVSTASYAECAADLARAFRKTGGVDAVVEILEGTFGA